MVEQNPSFPKIFSVRKGLTEAELLPFLTMLELLKFSSLNQELREIMTIDDARCINIKKLMEPRIRKFTPNKKKVPQTVSKIDDCTTFF